MSQSDVMHAEIKARNQGNEYERMKAQYQSMIEEQHSISKATTQAKAAPATKRHNPKLLLTRSI